MRRGRLFVVLVLGVLAPSSVRAAEATFAVEAGAQFDSNVFSTPTQLVNDVSLRPAVEVGLKADPSSDFQWNLMYRPDYQGYISTSGISGFDHLARVNLDYHISGATDVFFNEQFQRVLSLVDRSQTLQADQAGLGQPALIFGRQAVTLNDVQAGITHNFTPRLQGTLNLSNSLYYPQASTVSNASTSGVTGDLIYALTHTDRIGSSVGFTYQSLSATDIQPQTSTRYYQLMGIWIHDFSPTFQLDMRAGPTWVDPSSLNLVLQPQQATQIPIVTLKDKNNNNVFFAVDPTNCPTENGVKVLAVNSNGCQLGAQLDPNLVSFLEAHPVTLPVVPGSASGSTSELTYFAAINLVKHWERMDGFLTYQRTTGASSSFNQSTLLDTVEGRLLWRPSELWNMTLSASWSRRTSASNQPAIVTAVQPLGANTAGLDPNKTAENVGITTVTFHDAIDVDSYIAYLRLDRRITRRASVFGLVMFINQTDNSSFASVNDFTDYRAEVGFRYEFDPLPLAL